MLPSLRCVIKDLADFDSVNFAMMYVGKGRSDTGDALADLTKR